MAQTKTVTQPKNCPSCGAPVTSEICAYCGTATGLDTATANMEYPVLECREATLNFWTVWFPMIFAAAFGLPGLIVPIISFAHFGNSMLALICLPFLLIGIAALCLTLRTLLRYAKVKSNGDTIPATVYGYMDDNVLINNRPAQIVKLLVRTPDGPRFILYQLGNTIKPYKINDTVNVMMYQNYFLICHGQKTAQF